MHAFKVLAKNDLGVEVFMFLRFIGVSRFQIQNTKLTKYQNAKIIHS